MELEDEISAKRVLQNHKFVAHKRQEHDQQHKLCGRKGGRRRGAKHKIVPNQDPLSSGGGPDYDLLHPMQEKNVTVTEENCKYGDTSSPSLVKDDDET